MAKNKRKSLREKLNISRWAIAHSRLTISFWLAVTIAGLFAFTSLKYALFPDITFPVVIINAKAPLETAIETEKQLTQPLENQLKSLDALEEILSSTYPGQTAISLYFLPKTNLQTSTQAVKTSLNQLSLPPGSTFEVIPFNLNESSTVTYAIISESKTLRELKQITSEKIIPTLTQLPGVFKVNILGDDNIKAAENGDVTTFPTLVRFNGQNALAFSVIKTSDGNTLEVVKQVEKAVAKLQTELPEIKLILAETQAEFIRESTQATIDSLIQAIILAILVIFPFLRNFRATIITALAIPLSLLGTFIVMAIFGLQLESITLLALALVIGIIVDDAIVDVENISRHLEEGVTPRQAAILGTDEIGLTVSASTITIVAVFLPVAFMGGTVGQFFKPFGLTVSASVLISLLVARTLSPVLAVFWLKPRTNLPANQEEEKVGIITNYYRKLLQWSLHHRQIVIAIAILSLIAGIALIPLIPKGFIPQLDRGAFNIVYTSPLPKFSGGAVKRQENNSPSNDSSFDWIGNLANSPEKLLLRKTRSVGEELEKVVLQFDEVETIFTIAGVQGKPTQGKIYVKLKDETEITTAEFKEQIRASLPPLRGVSSSVEDIPFVDSQAGEKSLQILILGDDLTELKTTAQQIKTQIEKLPGFVDVAISGEGLDGENSLQIQRRGGKRVIYLTANLQEGIGVGNATEQAIALAQPLLPPHITLQPWGDSARSNTVLKRFGRTLLFSVICMLIVLIFPFGRLLEPLVVALSLPLSIVGAMLALLITQSDFGMISLIGLIFLLGLLDKNAILLMDYANQLRQKGKEREEAILETGVVRLRPIIMTTASTILGMLPLALGWGAGAELRQPMAVVIIGGLLTSSLLSLIIVPVLYTLLDDLWYRQGV